MDDKFWQMSCLLSVLSFSFHNFINLVTGVVTSKNFPDKYPKRWKRQETIKVAEGMILSLVFTAFDIRHHPSCNHDYLQITNGDKTTLMKKSCGNSLPAPMISKSNVVRLNFKTSGGAIPSHRGWRMIWKAVMPMNTTTTSMSSSSYSSSFSSASSSSTSSASSSPSPSVFGNTLLLTYRSSPSSSSHSSSSSD